MRNLRIQILLSIIILDYACIQSQTRLTNRTSYENNLKAIAANNPNRIVNIKQYLNSTEGLYACKSTSLTYASMISPLSFRILLLPLYTKAVANDEGIVKNGTSLSYSYNEDKATASINYLVNFKNNSNCLLNITSSGSSDGSFIYISNKNKANYGFEISPKFSFMFGRNSIFLMKPHVLN